MNSVVIILTSRSRQCLQLPTLALE